MTLPERAHALAASLAASRVITPSLTDDSATLTVHLDEAAILAALEDTRREAIEEAANRLKTTPCLDHDGYVVETSAAIKHVLAPIDGPQQGTTP